jgi:2-polyprenyl-3-methyl-5-hydroxy-6-metoxy-1,4-benzoquinol methylase
MVDSVATARYDSVAEFYIDGWNDAIADPGTAALLELAGACSGLRVLDVACGHGRVTRALARQGATVTGVDISERLLARARQLEKESVPGITYLRADLTTGTLPLTGPFDLVTCNFGLSDIDDLAAALRAVVGVMRAGSAFVFSILHPCFPGGGEVSGSWPGGRGYWAEGFWLPSGRASALRRQVGANHRMLSTYLNALIDAGLVIDALLEPEPDAAWRASHPDAAVIPVYLAVSTTLAGHSARAQNPRGLTG